MAPSRAPSVAPSRASTSHSASRSQAGSRASTSKQTTSQQSTTATSSTGERYTIAVHEQRGVGREIGLAMMQQGMAKVILTQFSDSSTCVKATHLFNSKRPGVLIVLPTAAGVANPTAPSPDKGRDKSILVKTVEKEFEDCEIVPFSRNNYNELAGLTLVEKLILNDEGRNATMTPLRKKSFALSAASALFKYLETQRVAFPDNSLRISYQPLEGTCLIDQDTIKYLELVTNLTNPKSKQSLFGALNATITPGGARLLKATILSPLTDIPQLNARLDAVSELKESESRSGSLRKALEPLHTLDLEKLVASIATYDSQTGFLGSGRTIHQLTELDPAKEADKNLSKVFQLRTFMVAVPALKAALDPMQSETLQYASTLLGKEDLGEVLTEINKTLNQQTIAQTASATNRFGSRTTKVFAIKAERDRLLDVARETFQEAINDINTYTEQLKAKYRFQFDYNYSASAGVTFRAPKEEIPSSGLPKVFTNVVNRGPKQIEFSSLELKKLNQRFNSVVAEVFMQENRVLAELFDKVLKKIAPLYLAAESIALIDMLASFAEVATKNGYVRPEFGRSLAIKAGRHILHERFRALDGAFQPNDTFSSAACSFQIVTGPNMSGKSVYLRQLALLHVVAQIGSFVPADYCNIKVCHSILSRLGNDDSITDSLSTFGQEMATMSMILSTLSTTTHSLVLVDELGRGTSPEEGVGLAHAISAQLIRAKATVFFATHFKELSTTLSRYPQVVTYHLHAETDRSKPDFSMVYSHKVQPGVSPMAHYGLELVKAVKLPADVLVKASEVSLELDLLEQDGKKRLAGSTVVKRRRALLELRTNLRELAVCDHLTPKEINDRLQGLQNQLVYSLADTIEREKDAEGGGVESGEDWVGAAEAAAGGRIEEVAEEDGMEVLGGGEVGTGVKAEDGDYAEGEDEVMYEGDVVMGEVGGEAVEEYEG